jgi:hypothetical protein
MCTVMEKDNSTVTSNYCSSTVVNTVFENKHDNNGDANAMRMRMRCACKKKKGNLKHIREYGYSIYKQQRTLTDL